jgi:hypothetical protein
VEEAVELSARSVEPTIKPVAPKPVRGTTAKLSPARANGSHSKADREAEAAFFRG